MQETVPLPNGGYAVWLGPDICVEDVRQYQGERLWTKKGGGKAND
jgi:hypothetical protein